MIIHVFSKTYCLLQNDMQPTHQPPQYSNISGFKMPFAEVFFLRSLQSELWNQVRSLRLMCCKTALVSQNSSSHPIYSVAHIFIKFMAPPGSKRNVVSYLNLRIMDRLLQFRAMLYIQYNEYRRSCSFPLDTQWGFRQQRLFCSTENNHLRSFFNTAKTL